MSKDFIRYYIGEISFNSLQSIQRESRQFDDWSLIESSHFDHEKSYGYEPLSVLDRNKLRIEAVIKQSSVIAEHREPEKVKPSLLWANTSNIADILTLISLARARFSPRLLAESNIGKHYILTWGVITREEAGSWDIVPVSNLSQFISGAISFIEQNPEWLDDSGFIPSLFWYTQAQVARTTAPSILEISLYWICIEIIAGVYNDKHSLGITHKKDRVKKYIEEMGYTGNCWFFLNELIDNWYLTRCSAFHEGREAQPIGVLSTRRQQVRDFTSLVLVEMLQQLEDSSREEIAKRIKSY